VFDQQETWLEEKDAPEKPIGTNGNTLAFTLSVDIDGIGDIKNLGVKEAVEDAGQFFVDYLKKHGIKNSVYCLFSGGGIYVHLHHGMFTIAEYNDPEQTAKEFTILGKAFNLLIAEVSREFFHQYCEHIGKVKFDKLNNQKRTFKTIFSIHKRLPYAVIPLNPEEIKISFSRASLPLSNEVIEEGKAWYSSFDIDERPSLGEMLKPFLDEAMENESTTAGCSTGTISRKPAPILRENFPPCIKNIIRTATNAEGRHRALGVLATYLYQAGWEEDAAHDLWEEVADRCGVEDRVFRTEWGRVCCPNCDTMKKNTGGYPNLNLYGMNMCSSDLGCLKAHWPGEYNALAMKASPGFVMAIDDTAEPLPTRLANLARRNCMELWHTPGGKAYITLNLAGHKEYKVLDSKPIKAWLSRLASDFLGETASATNLKSVITLLEGIALYDGHEYELHVRKAEQDGKIYVDMGDASWKALEISKDGWKIIDSCPIRFFRPKSLLPMLMPETGGKIEDLKQIINVSDNDTWIRTTAWLTQVFWCKGPYVHLHIRGAQGSAKSDMANNIKRIADPSRAPKRHLPKASRDLMMAGQNESIPSFDNVSEFSDEIADTICTMATGGASAARELYTDSDEALIYSKCPIIMNGIADPSQRGDLIDRLMILDLESISEDHRVSESEMQRRMATYAPKLLGVLLDATVTGLINFDKVVLHKSPRMADFAQWAIACSGVMGWEPDEFMDIYQITRTAAQTDMAETNILMRAIKRFAEKQPDTWEGTSTELLTSLNTQDCIIAGHEPDGWPRAAQNMGTEVRRLVQPAESQCVNINFFRKGGKNLISIRYQPTNPMADCVPSEKSYTTKIDSKVTCVSNVSFLEKTIIYRKEDTV
jgi:hypothetical protein